MVLDFEFWFWVFLFVGLFLGRLLVFVVFQGFSRVFWSRVFVGTFA